MCECCLHRRRDTPVCALSYERMLTRQRSLREAPEWQSGYSDDACSNSLSYEMDTLRDEFGASPAKTLHALERVRNRSVREMRFGTVPVSLCERTAMISNRWEVFSLSKICFITQKEAECRTRRPTDVPANRPSALLGDSLLVHLTCSLSSLHL